MYFALITDYGFNLSATHQISIHRHNHEKISKIFSSIIIIKTILLTLSIFFIFLLVIFVEKFNQNWEVYLISFGIVIGQALFPIWLFQGLEKMKIITIISLFTRIIFLILIFIFVRDQSDYLLVPLFNSISLILGGAWSLHIVINKLGYKFRWQSFEELVYQIKNGWHIFFSSAAISCYTASTTFILGLLTNNTIVGLFSAAEKIIQASIAIYTPVSQAIYPMMGKLFVENKASALRFVKKLISFIVVPMFLISASLYFFSDYIVNIILGSQYANSAVILRIMSPLPLIVALSNIFGIQIMLNLGFKSAFSKILSAAALLGIISNLVSVNFYQEIGSAYTILLIEIFVTASMFFYLIRKSILKNI
jgi:PST family polysaccharide transporter